MESSNNGRRIITISLTEENYQSVKKCADILGTNLSVVIDKMLTNKLPSDGDAVLAEILAIDALMTYSANLDDAQFNQMLVDIIISLENLKTSPTEGRSIRLDRLKAYLQTRDS